MSEIKRQVKLQNRQVSISCVVPVYNEQAVIAPFIQALHQALGRLTDVFDIIIVDDGSTDRTLAMCDDLQSLGSVKLLALSRNFGKEIALTAGIDHASHDVVVLMDADFQHPIDCIPRFLEQWANGYDMVYGLRDNRQTESYLKRQFAKCFYWLMRKITHIHIPSHAGDFRLMDRKVVKAIMSLPERSRFMKGLYAWVGFKSIAVPFTVNERYAGETSWRFSKLTELAITGITSFSDVPLRVWGWVGFIISFISLLYAIYIITVTLMYGADLPGFPTIIVAVMFLGGIQLLSIGILGEYIARIFTEVKQRPQYVIADKKGFDE